MEIDKIMKKRYNSPVIEIIEISSLSVLALSYEEEEVELRGNSGNQKSDEVRNDWDNIWEGM